MRGWMDDVFFFGGGGGGGGGEGERLLRGGRAIRGMRRIEMGIVTRVAEGTGVGGSG